MLKKLNILLLSFILIASIPFSYAETWKYNYLSEEEPTINYSLIPSINNSDYWDGNAWSDTRWLNIDGSNANQNINIGAYGFKATSSNITTISIAGLFSSNYYSNLAGSTALDFSEAGVIKPVPSQDVDLGEIESGQFNNAYFKGNVTANWLNGLFDWITGDNWNSFDGHTLTFNETKLNNTIDARSPDSGNDFEVFINGSAYNNVVYNITKGDADDVIFIIEPGKKFIFGDTFT